MRQRLSKQYNIGPWLGGFKDLASRTMVYVSAISFTQVSATFYYTTLYPELSKNMPWISFWFYFALLVAAVLLIMIIEYKVVVPSSYTFLNKQEYLHENLIRKDIAALRKELKEMRRELSEGRNNSSS